MLIPGQYTLKIYQGSTLRLPLTYSDDAGNIYVLSAYKARLQVRPYIDSPVKLVDLTSDPGGGITLADAAPNILIEESDAVTALLTPTRAIGNRCVFDLELEAPNGTVTRIMQGPVQIIAEVTR